MLTAVKGNPSVPKATAAKAKEAVAKVAGHKMAKVYKGKPTRKPATSKPAKPAEPEITTSAMPFACDYVTYVDEQGNESTAQVLQPHGGMRCDLQLANGSTRPTVPNEAKKLLGGAYWKSAKK